MSRERRLLAPVIRDVVKALDPKPEDAGIAALAVQYAAAIDESRRVAEAAWELHMSDIFADYRTARDALAAVQQKLTWRATLSELGPRLLACLEALGASPKTRKALGLEKPAAPAAGAKGGTTDDAGSSAPEDELARYRRSR